MEVETINELPEDILVLIFRRFDLFERLQLRSVCLRWKSIIEHFRVRDVSVVDRLLNKRECWLYYGYESLNWQNLIYYSEQPPSLYQRLTSLLRPEELTGSLQLLVKNPMFSTLKSLFLALKSIENFFCFEKYINPHFPQLEQLSCKYMCLEKTCLNLPNLKVLSLFLSSLTRIRLELPSMYKLSTNLSLHLLEFTHPQSVTHLFSPEDDKSIVRFSNLEYFCCFWFKNEHFTFSKLTKLKEIDLRFSPWRMDQERFAKIYEAKQKLNSKLKMFVREVAYERPLPPFWDQEFKDVISAYVSGKMRASPIIPLNSTLVYDDLFDTFGRVIPSELKANLTNIRTVKASQRVQEDVHSFFSLLANYPNLYVLDLNSAFDGLSDEQAYYDSLPSFCKYLRELKIHWPSKQTTLIDMSFVFHFRYLQKLEINQKVRSNFIRLLFKKLKYFRVLKLSRGKRGHQIEKDQQNPNRYSLWVDQREFFPRKDFTSLLMIYYEKIERFDFPDLI